ncbi:MAG: hypothetical protein U1A72_12560 [Sulfuritalea sp.]|nr:hypothetical protein [Sulfuritalea sp.]
MQPNAIVFVVTYLILMVPTYVLPYFGSNSSIVNAISAAVGLGMTPQWWAHAWSLGMMCLLAWARGGTVGRAWLPVLPALATVFELTPVLNLIPLIPTLLHIGTLLAGFIGSSADDREAATTLQPALNRKATRSAIVVTLCAMGGAGLFLFTAKTTATKLRPAAPGTNLAAPTPTRVNPPLATSAPPVEPTSVSTGSAPEKPPATKAQRPATNRADKVKKETNKPPAATGTTTRYINLND